MNNTDTIEKEILVAAPIERVWRALSDFKEFGQWFQVRLDQPFEPGGASTGRMTIPGLEHVRWHARILTMQENKSLSFTWPPYVDDATLDLSQEPWLTTEFTLTETPEGTVVKVVESGFAGLSPEIRSKARTGNVDGWDFQMNNLARYVAPL